MKLLPHQSPLYLDTILQAKSDGHAIAHFKKLYTGSLMVLYTDTGSVLRCTEEHPIYVGPDRGFVPAKNIVQGDLLYGKYTFTEPNDNEKSLQMVQERVCTYGEGRCFL
jgi:hypothetical protein